VLRRAAIALIAGSLSALPAPAQATTDSSRTETERASLRLASGGDVTLTMGGYLQVDGRWVSGALQSQPDGLLLRRARLIVDALMPSGWLVRLQPDFGQGRVLVQDAFVGRQFPRATLRVGRFRPAYGVERFQSSAALLHGERSLLNTLMPSRSFGAQALLSRGAVTFAVGGFRTPIGSDLQLVDTDGDVEAIDGSGHDLLARLAWSRRRGPRYLEAQAALLDGRERGEADATGLTRVLTVGQQPLLAFRSDGSEGGTAVAAGARRRWSAGGVLGNAHSMLGLEGALTQQAVRLGTSERSVHMGAATWRVAHLLGGTRRATQEVQPIAPQGAFDLGARLSVLGVWGDSLDTVITRRSVTHATSGGVALAWIPTLQTRLSLAYDLTLVSPARTVREHALLLRVQQGF
jgi:phosphate-selective porin OprO/OprP